MNDVKSRNDVSCMLFAHAAQNELDALQSTSIATQCWLFLSIFAVCKYFVISAAISW